MKLFRCGSADKLCLSAAPGAMDTGYAEPETKLP